MPELDSFKLTDRWVTSLNNAICKWNYCPPEGGWPVSLLRELNLKNCWISGPGFNPGKGKDRSNQKRF